MTRNDDLRKSVGKRGKRGSLRRTTWTRRARLTVLSIALGLASLPFLPCDLGIERAVAVSTITSSSLQGAQSAASKSLYAQRQQQARLDAQRQAAAQAQARAQAENQARLNAQRQAQAQAAQAQAAAQAENSKKSFLSDIFKREPVGSNANSLGATGSFNNYERAQFASRNIPTLPNAPRAEKSGLGLSLFKKKGAPEQANPQGYAANQAPNAASYGRTNARGAAPSSAVLAQASSSPNDSRDALAKVPWDLMPQQTRERLSQLASSPTLYRRLPMSGGSCNPELFDFFLTYPQTVVELWRASGYDGLTMTSEGNGAYTIAEKGGSSGRIQIIYQDSELTLVHCYGSYVSPISPRPLEGEAFLILQTRYTEDAAKTPLVVCRLDAFIGIKNMGADLLARTFNSFVGKIADSNFENTLGFICGVSRSIEGSPQEFQRVASSLNLDPTAKSILLAKTQEVARQARARQAGQTVEYRLLAKANAPQPGYARILARGDSNNSLPNGQSVLASAPGVASSSSFGKTIDLSMSRSPSISSNEFALAPDGEFEESIDWGDDERMATGEEILASKRSDSSTSVAKIGAKTSKNSSVIDLLDEQEDSDQSNAQYDELVSTDSDEPGDDALLTDDEDSTDAATLTDDALLLDDSSDDALATDESEDSDELTMTLDIDESESDLKDSPVAIPYAAQTTLEDESEEEVVDDDLIAMPTLESESEGENETAPENEDLLTTLELPVELEESAETSEDAPVVPLAASTKNPSNARAKALNAMKRTPKKEKKSEPAAVSALAEASPEAIQNEEEATALSEATPETVKKQEKTATESETASEDWNASEGFKPVEKIDQTPSEPVTMSTASEDAEFEAVAQGMEANWTPVLDAGSTESTPEKTGNRATFTRRNDGFQSIAVENARSETSSKVDEQNTPVFSLPSSRRNAATESDEETGPVKRFVTRRFSPRSSSENNKPIPSFRSIVNGNDDGDDGTKIKPIERLKNAVNPNASN